MLFKCISLPPPPRSLEYWHGGLRIKSSSQKHTTQADNLFFHHTLLCIVVYPLYYHLQTQSCQHINKLHKANSGTEKSIDTQPASFRMRNCNTLDVYSNLISLVLHSSVVVVVSIAIFRNRHRMMASTNKWAEARQWTLLHWNLVIWNVVTRITQLFDSWKIGTHTHTDRASRDAKKSTCIVKCIALEIHKRNSLERHSHPSENFNGGFLVCMGWMEIVFGGTNISVE